MAAAYCIGTSPAFLNRYLHEKEILNFGSRSDDEFLEFLLDTVSMLVTNFRHVFEQALPSDIRSVRKRLNKDRFRKEQVNKYVDNIETEDVQTGTSFILYCHGNGSVPNTADIPYSQRASCQSRSINSNANHGINPKNSPAFKSLPKLFASPDVSINMTSHRFFQDIVDSDDSSEGSQDFVNNNFTSEADNDTIIVNTVSELPSNTSPISFNLPQNTDTPIPSTDNATCSNQIIPDQVIEDLASIITPNRPSDTTANTPVLPNPHVEASTPSPPSNLYFNSTFVTPPPTQRRVTFTTDGVSDNYPQNSDEVTDNYPQNSDEVTDFSLEVTRKVHEAGFSPESTGVMSADVSPTESFNHNTPGRKTDCRDRLCQFCASYDPEYAEEYFKGLEKLDDGAKSISDLYVTVSENTPHSPDLQLHSWRDWSILTESKGDTSASIVSDLNVIDADEIPESVTSLTDKELRDELQEQGATVGPILKDSRKLYEQYLMKLRQKPKTVKDDLKRYPKTLRSCLLEQPQKDWSEAEKELVDEYSNPSVTRKFRQGTTKCSFNYLLLDPRPIGDLMDKARSSTPVDMFRLFVKSVFYVGKGKQSRPYQHLIDASTSNKVSTKLKKIRDIWGSGRGVVSLHVFNNILAEEAFNREALLIACIGVSNLTNEKEGEYYGTCKRWNCNKKHGVGTSLLYKAYLTLLNEGMRELKKQDVSRKP